MKMLVIIQPRQSEAFRTSIWFKLINSSWYSCSNRQTKISLSLSFSLEQVKPKKRKKKQQKRKKKSVLWVTILYSKTLTTIYNFDQNMKTPLMLKPSPWRFYPPTYKCQHSLHSLALPFLILFLLFFLLCSYLSCSLISARIRSKNLTPETQLSHWAKCAAHKLR